MNSRGAGNRAGESVEAKADDCDQSVAPSEVAAFVGNASLELVPLELGDRARGDQDAGAAKTGGGKQRTLIGDDKRPIRAS